ncbi:MAG: DNA polymerase III subunit gamma/tau [Boseongicola sp. SB0673_bin_14]|nr:DNA polymerase III subunit gamma/tau [Boseongicola sp. SB0673_bin_14]
MTDGTDIEYQVLARKYRPETFADLVGQDAMVRTLTSAFAADRIAQAFILTGIRGTGKTTTARIIAKGMNCIGSDGNGDPTISPCGTCEHCVAISQGRHVDVLELDAASRTGVNDIREIIESVHYSAASARYKIYIFDEVHMLSTSAFNALLKTLEEPPAHVKFIFATTEIRKVPVTVLSRCQRFDLRRIEPETMMEMLRRIATAESAEITDEALALVTRAAEGSARDATSLLDQAISDRAQATDVDQVRAMIGLADRGRVLDLFELIMTGDVAGALAELSAQYSDGADPMAVLRDIADITHWISVIRITPEAVNDPTVAPEERTRGCALADKLPMPVLSRMWQMALKALEEAGNAPDAMMAAEMAVIRMTHVADLPTPGELVAKLKEPASSSASPTPSSTPPPSSSGREERGPAQGPGTSAVATRAARAATSGGAVAAAAVQPAHVQNPDIALARFPTFAHVVDLIRANREVKLCMEVEENLRLVSYKPGRIEFEPGPTAARDLAQRLGQGLKSWTGVRWAVSVTASGGQPTISESRNAATDRLKDAARKNETVAAILSTFPNAKIGALQTAEALTVSAAESALDEIEDEWDPFEGD